MRAGLRRDNLAPGKMVSSQTELRKPASTASVLAEHSSNSKEHICPLNIKSPPGDIDWDKGLPNHVITIGLINYNVF